MYSTTFCFFCATFVCVNVRDCYHKISYRKFDNCQDIFFKSVVFSEYKEHSTNLAVITMLQVMVSVKGENSEHLHMSRFFRLIFSTAFSLYPAMYCDEDIGKLKFYRSRYFCIFFFCPLLPWCFERNPRKIQSFNEGTPHLPSSNPPKRTRQLWKECRQQRWGDWRGLRGSYLSGETYPHLLIESWWSHDYLISLPTNR